LSGRRGGAAGGAAGGVTGSGSTAGAGAGAGAGGLAGTVGTISAMPCAEMSPASSASRLASPPNPSAASNRWRAALSPISQSL